MAVVDREILRIEHVTFVHEIRVLEDLIVVERSLLAVDVKELTTGSLMELPLRELVGLGSRGHAHHGLRNLKVSSGFYRLTPGLVLNIGLNIDNTRCQIVFGIVVSHGYTTKSAAGASNHELLLHSPMTLFINRRILQDLVMVVGIIAHLSVILIFLHVLDG